MIAWVHASHAKGDAPLGYLIARVLLAPGLFVDAELNPFTGFRFKCFGLFRTVAGNEECMESDAVALAWFEQPTAELGKAFDAIRAMYVEREHGVITEMRCDFCHPRPRG